MNYANSNRLKANFVEQYTEQFINKARFPIPLKSFLFPISLPYFFLFLEFQALFVAHEILEGFSSIFFQDCEYNFYVQDNCKKY